MQIPSSPLSCRRALTGPRLRARRGTACRPPGRSGTTRKHPRDLDTAPSKNASTVYFPLFSYFHFPFFPASDYRAGLHKIGTFDTIENFWKLYVFLKRPSALENNVNLYLFRDGPTIAPMWECFPNGGSWILKVKKKKDSGASVLGKMWQDMVLATIGEMFEEPDVLGISVCIRSREDLISVWHGDNRNENIRFGIGEKMKSILELEPSTVLEYKDFASSMKDMSSFRNAKAYVFAPNEDSALPAEELTIEEQAAAAVAAVGLAAQSTSA